MLTRNEAKEIADRELEGLTDKIQDSIRKALWNELDRVRKQEAQKELLFVRASKDALKRELSTSRLLSRLDSGYGSYINYLQSCS